MALTIYQKIKPDGNFAAVDAADVEMPDGTRLSDHDFLDAGQLPEAVDAALAQAKESGVFNGADGKDGADGKTPVRGEDYWTEEDKQEIVDEVLEQMPEPDGGTTTVLADLYPQTTIDGFVENGSYGFLKISQPPLFVLENGKNYTVFWDNERFDVTSFSATISGMGDFIVIGNGAGMGYPGNNEPFAIAVSENSSMIFAFVDNSTTHDLRVCYSETVPIPNLPAVTASDNGKFLRVVDGAWTAVALQDVSEVGE